MIAFWLALLLMQTQRATTSSIGGIVMKAGTVIQQPLQNARLELTGGPGTPLISRTDSAGRFMFSSLSAGRYRLFVTKDGFIRANLQLVLAGGQQTRDIVFRLEPAATIAGWVRDEFAEPAADVLVQALRRTYDARGNPTLSIVASSLTDDRGQYRIYWVDPGEYFVFASSAAPRIDEETTSKEGRRTFPPTYFPGVSEPADAKPIRVRIGAEMQGVDFRLRAVALTSVIGYVTSASSGKPVAAAITLSAPSQDPAFSRYRAQSNSGGLRPGEFAIPEGVVPGSYMVSARTSSGEETAFSRITIRAYTAPPPYPYDIRLTVSPPLTINGRYLMDPAKAAQTVDVRQSKITLTSLDSALPSPASISPQSDGQFSLTGVVPGTYVLSVSDLPEDLYVKDAKLDTAYVLDSPMNIAPTSTAPLQILLAPDGGRLTIAVFDRDNRPFSPSQVVLVPDASRRHRPDQYRLATTDPNGQVTIRGIPPGNYKVFAWENVEPNAYLNADYLRAYDDLGIAVHAVSGENAPIPVRVIPSE